MSDHREDIFAAAKSYTDSVRENFDNDEDDGGVYDIEVWRSNHDRRRVEFLLAGGGPTVWVVVDEFDRVDFHHSWGMDEEQQDRTVVGLVGEDADFWLGQAESYAEMMA